MKSEMFNGVILGVLLVGLPAYAEAEWAQAVFDVRCVPEIGYYSLKPHWVSAPEHLQRPVVPKPIDENSPSVTWDEKKLEALRKKGILFAGVYGEVKCSLVEGNIQAETLIDGRIMLSINGQKALLIKSEWWTYDGVTRKYELVGVSSNYGLWKADFIVSEFRKKTPNDRDAKISEFPLHFFLMPDELINGGLSEDQIYKRASEIISSTQVTPNPSLKLDGPDGPPT